MGLCFSVDVILMFILRVSNLMDCDNMVWDHSPLEGDAAALSERHRMIKDVISNCWHVNSESFERQLIPSLWWDFDVCG